MQSSQAQYQQEGPSTRWKKGLVEVNYCEVHSLDSFRHQLEASKKHHKVLQPYKVCKRSKAKKVILHTILLGAPL